MNVTDCVIGARISLQSRPFLFVGIVLNFMVDRPANCVGRRAAYMTKLERSSAGGVTDPFPRQDIVKSAYVIGSRAPSTGNKSMYHT